MTFNDLLGHLSSSPVNVSATPYIVSCQRQIVTVAVNGFVDFIPAIMAFTGTDSDIATGPLLYSHAGATNNYS